MYLNVSVTGAATLLQDASRLQNCKSDGRGGGLKALAGALVKFSGQWVKMSKTARNQPSRATPAERPEPGIRRGLVSALITATAK